LTIVLEDLIW